MIEHFDATWNELTADGAAFAMTEIEVRGHPMRVYNGAPATMRNIWEIGQMHGDKTYVIFEDERYTYAEIGAQVRSLAHLLRDTHGVGSGDRVAIGTIATESSTELLSTTNTSTALPSSKFFEARRTEYNTCSKKYFTL